MTRKWKMRAMLAAASLLLIIAFLLVLANKGAPAIALEPFKHQSGDLEQGQEGGFTNQTDARVPDMQLVAEEGELALYINEATTEIAVLHKPSSQVWYSNPPARNEDPLASAYEKELMSSQLVVTYRDSYGTLGTYLNYSRSIQHEQFTLEWIDKGVRVTYTLGDASLGIDALPKLIGKQRFEEKILQQLDESTARYVSARYYPQKGTPDVLERLDDQVSRKLVLTKMLEAFAQAGYTEEDLAQDNEEHGFGGGVGEEKPSFVIPLEYRLQPDGLTATVPMKHVVEAEGFPIRSIDLLGYFGAAGTEAEGYMFVPDGSGSLIQLNNNKGVNEQYVQRIYGADPNDNTITRGQVSQVAHLPVYGLKTGEGAFLTIIERGDALASVVADVSGRKNSYNNVYSSYAVRGEDTLFLYTGTMEQEIELLNKERYEGDIRLNIQLLTGESASYSGMAASYRSYLQSEGKLTPLQANIIPPFYLDLIGSLDDRAYMLGVPYRKVHAATTFDKAKELTEQLRGDGIDRVMMRYTGWFGKGIQHQTPTKLSLDRVLGSRSDMQQLATSLESNGGRLYPDVALQIIYQDDWGFAPAADATRFVTREQAKKQPFSLATNRFNFQQPPYWLLSPSKLPSFVDRFIKQYEDYKISGLSLRDLGSVLSSDYRNNRVVLRQSALEIVDKQLERIGSTSDLMLKAPHAYAWNYATHLTDVPDSSSGFDLTDYSIPFYQMVVFGSLEYAGEAMNLSDNQDMRSALLRAIEQGSNPYFVWSHTPSSQFKRTAYDYLYATNYSDWYETAVEMYEEIRFVRARTAGAYMSDHSQPMAGVARVVYSNGTVVIVNYTESDVMIDGQRIGAHDYWLGEETS